MRKGRLVAGLAAGAGCLGGMTIALAEDADSLRAGDHAAQVQDAVRGGAPSFVNFETPHIHPLDKTPDGSRLLAVNTPDNRLEVFNITPMGLTRVGAVPVGLDPVSVRARTNMEVWVVNQVSDSVSIVDLVTMNVIATLQTADEPADVVFAGAPERAFVSCSQANVVQVFDPANLGIAPNTVAIEGEDPRALAVSPDGSKVYAAVFESGNGTTILLGGSEDEPGFGPNVVSDPLGPYGGVNPPPNDGAAFRPAQRPGNPTPPAVGLIVRKNDSGQWLDDNNGDWTNLVSGPLAANSTRPIGWDLLDHDVAIIETGSLSVSYADRLMNICMALAVNPATQDITVVGTEATNEIRFEPVISGRFLRVNMATVDTSRGAAPSITDLNPHLTYTDDIPFIPIEQSERDQSLGDPRGIVWNNAGTKGFVSGMGSNNVVVIDAAGARAGLAPTIEVGEGPTGLALDEANGRLYVLNKFESSVSIIDLATELETARIPFYDPSPVAIKAGRKHLYDTHKNSGLGHISCASCHVDARMDRLAWDLGDPSGTVKAFDQNCIFGPCPGWHPMKGPMTTQTMQDIVGKEPFHWRGDRFGLEEFNGAFILLQGDDDMLTPAEMQEYEDFLATIHYPPNPYRNFNNTLPTNLPLPGHYTTGRFAPAGQPLPNGNAVAGLNDYRTDGLDIVNCVSCHTTQTGAGPDGFLNAQFQFVPVPPGPFGERHLALVGIDGSTNISMKIPQLRNMYEKTGFNTTQLTNTAGFGYLHDGSVDSVERFLAEPVFQVTSDQQVANLVALMLAFGGSDLPQGSPSTPLELPGPAGRDAHAAVGKQETTGASAFASRGGSLIPQMRALADAGDVGLIVKGRQGGLTRGYEYLPGGMLQSDRAEEIVAADTLLMSAAADSELTWTVVPAGAQRRIGIDRDEDGHFDRDELDAGRDPADPLSFPGQIPADLNGDGTVNSSDLALLLGAWGPCPALPTPCPADLNDDGFVNSSDLAAMLGSWG